MISALLIFSLTFSTPTLASTQDIPNPSDAKVLILVANGFGLNYFDAKKCLESWGVNVTTVAYALDYNVTACPNREEKYTIADLLLSEMTPEMVQEFDCLLVTSGGHWADMIAGETVLEFISDAFDLGLIVASICTGTRVVAEANGIVNGSKVVAYSLSEPQMMIAGATTVWGVEAVADGQIITGGRGGGTSGGGWLEAPTSEVCAEIVRYVLGLSRVTESTLTPSQGSASTNFALSINVDSLNEILGEILSTSIGEVTAHVYGFGNRTLVDTIELTDENHDGTYLGQFIISKEGDYVIDIEVEDSNSTLEVVKEIESFSVGLDPTKQMDIVLVYTLTGGSILIVILVVALIKKK